MAVTTLGAFPGANSKDKSARIPAAIAALNRALAGDMASLKYMQDQSQGSATAVGKDAFRRALDYYAANKPTAEQPASVDPRQQAPKPMPLPGVSVPGTTPAPIGFAPVPPDMQHPILVEKPGVSVNGAAPGIITEVTIGRPLIDPIPVVRRVLTGPRTISIPDATGGVYSGPPMDSTTTTSAPASTAIASSGGTSAAATPPAATDAAATTSKPGDNTYAWLILVAGVVLFAIVDGHRVRNGKA